MSELLPHPYHTIGKESVGSLNKCAFSTPVQCLDLLSVPVFIASCHNRLSIALRFSANFPLL